MTFIVSNLATAIHTQSNSCTFYIHNVQKLIKLQLNTETLDDTLSSFSEIVIDGRAVDQTEENLKAISDIISNISEFISWSNTTINKQVNL